MVAAKIIKIGNSRGLRIPDKLLKLAGMTNIVGIDVVEEGILLKPVKSKPREGWEDSFRRMHDEGDDNLLIDDGIDLDSQDWTW